MYIPGDVLIAGLVPITKQWNRDGGPETCSGLKIADDIDVLSEAFTFAIMSYKDRYTDMLQNVTVGAILFDSCSDTNRASQIMLNFESCNYDFTADVTGLKPASYIVPAYIALDYSPQRPEVLSESESAGKLALGVEKDGSIHTAKDVLYNSGTYNFKAVTSLLLEMDWTYVGVLTSASANIPLDGLYESANSKNICISYHARISTNSRDLNAAFKTVQESYANTVVIFATADEVDAIFISLTSRTISKTWILVESREKWLHAGDYPLPLGTIILEKQGKQNEQFNTHISSWFRGNSINYTSSNYWLEMYQSARSDGNQDSPVNDDVTRMQASDVIKTVDISLAVLDLAAKRLCGSSNGLCQMFLTNGTKAVQEEMRNVWFEYQAETVKLDRQTAMYENYVIKNLHRSGLNEVELL